MLMNPGREHQGGYLAATAIQTAVVLFLILLCLPLSLLAQDVAVRSSLSNGTITRDESVTLEIIAIGFDGELDISALNEDFEVVRRSSSREIRTITTTGNAVKNTSIVTWALELIPRGVGVFTVPAVKVGDLSSQIHTLTVNDLPSGAQRDVFVEATVDTTTPWVQSQIVMTLQVFQAIDIVDGGLGEPSGDNLQVERMAEDTRSVQERNGRQYSVTQRKFALFAQKSGEVVIDPVTLSVSVPAQSGRTRGFFSPTRKITRRTDSITLNVKPRPDSGSAWWLPARQVSLNSEWLGDIASAEVDKPLTRTIVLRAGGVLDSQLPDISIPAIDGVSLYADQPVRAMGANQDGLIAEQSIKWALIPQRVGTLTLPAITIDWFNTLTGQVETAVLPEESITVNPAGGTTAAESADSVASQTEQAIVVPGAELANTADESSRVANSAVNETQQSAAEAVEPLVNEPKTESVPEIPASSEALRNRLNILEESVSTWQKIAILALLLWLGMILYFLWKKIQQKRMASQLSWKGKATRFHSSHNDVPGKVVQLASLSGVAASCKGSDPVAIRAALLEWSLQQWPASPPLTLDGVARHLTIGPARESVMALQSALYGRQSAEQVVPLMDALQHLPDQLKLAIAGNRESGNVRSLSHTGEGLPSL